MPEDNQNNQNQATPAETVDNQNQSQEAGRTFTQDEVNKIIQARLDRERERQRVKLPPNMTGGLQN